MEARHFPPGILWSDYLCDGFATETQKRELRLLRTRLDALPETPAKKEP